MQELSQRVRQSSERKQLDYERILLETWNQIKRLSQPSKTSDSKCSKSTESLSQIVEKLRHSQSQFHDKYSAA